MGEASNAPRDRLLVVDVDDTLFLEREYVRSGFRAVGEHVRRTEGIDGFAELAWRSFEAGVRGDTFDRLRVDLGIRTSVEELVGVYRGHRPTIDLLPEATDLLAAGRPRCVIGVVTDGPAVCQWAKIRALDLETMVDRIVVTADHGGGWTKPSRLPFEACARDLGIAPHDSVHVADNPAKDFLAPRELGWRTLRVRHPLSLHAEVPASDDVDVEVTGIGDAIGILREWGFVV